MLKKVDSGSSFLDLIKRRRSSSTSGSSRSLRSSPKGPRFFSTRPACPGNLAETLWGAIFSNIDEAVQALTKGLPKNATVALMPEGPYVLAKASAAA